MKTTYLTQGLMLWPVCFLTLTRAVGDEKATWVDNLHLFTTKSWSDKILTAQLSSTEVRLDLNLTIGKCEPEQALCSPIFRQTGQRPKKCLLSLLDPASRCSDPSFPRTNKPPAARRPRHSPTHSSMAEQNNRTLTSEDNMKAGQGQRQDRKVLGHFGRLIS